MPMSPQQARAVELRERGLSRKETAREMGVREGAVKGLLERAKKWENADPVITRAATALGVDNPANLKAFWQITKDEDGNGYSGYIRNPDTGFDDQPESVVDRIAERLGDFPSAPKIARPQNTSGEFLNFIPVFDFHLSMRIGSYGTAEAVQRIREGAESIFSRMPPAQCTIILNGGDFTEHNDPSNQTPASKHPLDVDMAYDDTIDVATDVTVDLINRARQISDKVVYVPLRGNHDPNTARILRAAMRAYYRSDDSVEIANGMNAFTHAWEGNMITAVHGDLKRKAHEIVLGLAARHPDLWSDTWFRDLYTGHLHSLKVEEFPGMTKRQVRAICPQGRYATDNLMESLSEMIGVTYKRGGGYEGMWPHTFR